jgi:hypothetical protein
VYFEEMAPNMVTYHHYGCVTWLTHCGLAKFNSLKFISVRPIQKGDYSAAGFLQADRQFETDCSVHNGSGNK